MEDYAIRRREYVQSVRASFEEDTTELENIDVPQSFLGIKLRIFFAIIIFFVILFCKYSSYEIFGFNIEEIIDMISDNQYYTILQKYVKL